MRNKGMPLSLDMDVQSGLMIAEEVGFVPFDDQETSIF
jgi:hypothetical protein